MTMVENVDTGSHGVATTGLTRGQRERCVGMVISDKGNKTITVRVDYTVKHPKYGKYYRRSTHLRTHDERNEARVGDVVEVTACRRLSKTKCWRLSRIVRSVG